MRQLRAQHHSDHHILQDLIHDYQLGAGTTEQTIKNYFLINHLAKQGLNAAAIAKQLGKSYVLIHRYLDQELKRPYQEFTPDDEEFIRSHYDPEGEYNWSIAKIAGVLNRLAASVSDVVDRQFKARQKQEKRSFTPDDEEFIRSHYDPEGEYNWSIAKIAREKNRSIPSVSAVVDRQFKARQKREKRSFTVQQDHEIRELYQQGYNPGYISLRIDRDRGTIRRHLKNLPDYDLLHQDYKKNQKVHQRSQGEIHFFETISQLPEIQPLNPQHSVPIPTGGRHGDSYKIDLFIEDPPMIVEYYGDLYHANPLRFQDDNTPLPKVGKTAGERRRLNQEKEEYLRQKGFTLVVIWEDEWQKTQTRPDCIRRVLQALKQAYAQQKQSGSAA